MHLIIQVKLQKANIIRDVPPLDSTIDRRYMHQCIGNRENLFLTQYVLSV